MRIARVWYWLSQVLAGAVILGGIFWMATGLLVSGLFAVFVGWALGYTGSSVYRGR